MSGIIAEDVAAFIISLLGSPGTTEMLHALIKGGPERKAAVTAEIVRIMVAASDAAAKAKLGADT